MKRYLPFLIIAVVLVAGIATFLIFSKKGSGSDSGSTFVGTTTPMTAPNVTSQPAQPAPTELPGSTRPNVKVSSPVILEEYGDYQCPPCGALYPELKKIESEYGNQLRIVFRHFPLEKLHKNAMVAAQAAEAARNQNKFWEMHDRLYRTQDAWKDYYDPRAMFTAYARELKMNVDRFTRDLDSTEVKNRINADIQRGAGVGVTGTPTVFIEGHMLRFEHTTPDGLRRGINILLEKKANS
jgi:protein-disulfide isomerase